MEQESAAPEVRIADLGSSFSVTGTDTRHVGFQAQTLPYRAPEVSSFSCFVILPAHQMHRHIAVDSKKQQVDYSFPPANVWPWRDLP